MKGGVFALGNFDGVHRGHRAVVECAIENARKRGIPARVLTFEPHPRSFFQPKLAPFRLTPAPVKERLLKALGIDNVVTFPFTEKLADMPARAFVEDILLEKLGAQHVVAGHDFVFGHNRDGNVKKLASLLGGHGVGVSEVEELGGDGEEFSSTRIRELLLEGEVEAASAILGRDWSIEGTVVKGKALGGRVLGFPTANVSLGEYLRPKFGVYAVRAGRAGEPLTHRGVANIGLRPTVNDKDENLEVFLFDFDEDIYGQRWEFSLTHFIRPERKFDTLDALKAQIEEDVKAAKKYK
jgi:riboflavin kinase/FMN adenylyltransferase